MANTGLISQKMSFFLPQQAFDGRKVCQLHHLLCDLLCDLVRFDEPIHTSCLLMVAGVNHILVFSSNPPQQSSCYCSSSFHRLGALSPMAYRSQAERRNLSIKVPLVQVDATACIDASPGRPVLDVSSPKALGSPTKQSLLQQRKQTNSAAEVHQRRRRSCHGTLAEQHSPGWQLKQSWTLDSKLPDGTPFSSVAAANTSTYTDTICSSNISSIRRDATGSSSKHDQQQLQAAAAPAAAEPMQQHQQAAADADVTIHAVRPPSPFAAPEVQACSCHTYCGKQGCKMHTAASTRMVYTGTGTGTDTTTPSSSSSGGGDSSSTHGTRQKVGQRLRKVGHAVWQGISLACWSPSATVPGTGGAYLRP